MRLARPTAILAALAAALLVGGPAVSASGDTQHRSVPTRTVVVRPVTASGAAAPGWTVKRERGLSVFCDEGPAPAAVDDDIRLCGPSAAYTPACWKSTDHTVLCLRDARSRALTRIHYTGSFKHATAPAHPSPQALRLGDGSSCQIRVGGAWGQIPTHPQWVGFYSCSHGEVYGPAKGDGIVRTAPRWSVRLWKGGSTVTTHGVRTAWLVGTAA